MLAAEVGDVCAHEQTICQTPRVITTTVTLSDHHHHYQHTTTITITRPKPPLAGSWGKDTFWGVLNVSLCAFGAQLGLDSVYQMLLQF